MKRWLTRVFILLFLAAAAFGAAAWYQERGERSGVSFRTAPVRHGDLLATIAATGTLEPEEVVDVGAQVAGQITEFGKDVNGNPIDYDSTVREGMVLAQIDDSLYKADFDSTTAQIARANAGVRRAQADLGQLRAKQVQAEGDWKRAQLLGQSEALAQTLYDQYKATYEVAMANVAVGEAALAQSQSEVTQAEAALVRVNRNLNYCTIRSPIDGVIIDRRVNIGQTVVASLNAPSLFLIAKDLRRMEVWVPVNEADIGSVHVGQPVTFTVDAFPNRTFTGEVGKVRKNAVMTQNVVTFTVEVITDNSDGTLLPYLTANVQFEAGRRENVLLVPNSALRWTPRAELIDPGAGNGNTASPDEDSAGAPSAMGRGRGRGRGAAGADNATAVEPGAAERGSAGTLWVQAGAFVRPIQVRVGLTDGTNTEILGNDVAEGTAVVLGEMRADTVASGPATPFMPQFNRGRGSGARRGGRGG